jgi:hypothetical protein
MPSLALTAIMPSMGARTVMLSMFFSARAMVSSDLRRFSLRLASAA